MGVNLNYKVKKTFILTNDEQNICLELLKLIQATDKNLAIVDNVTFLVCCIGSWTLFPIIKRTMACKSSQATTLVCRFTDVIASSTTRGRNESNEREKIKIKVLLFDK